MTDQEAARLSTAPDEMAPSLAWQDFHILIECDVTRAAAARRCLDRYGRQLGNTYRGSVILSALQLWAREPGGRMSDRVNAATVRLTLRDWAVPPDSAKPQRDALRASAHRLREIVQTKPGLSGDAIRSLMAVANHCEWVSKNW